MAKRIIKNKRALSPVIATVILVSVTIVVAVAVAYWMGGIAGLYTRFEQIEITITPPVKENGFYNITVQLKNKGSSDATITGVIINGKPYDQYNQTTEIKVTSLPLTVLLGKSKYLYIEINATLWEPGTTINMQFQSAAGKSYPAMTTL